MMKRVLVLAALAAAEAANANNNNKPTFMAKAPKVIPEMAPGVPKKTADVDQMLPPSNMPNMPKGAVPSPDGTVTKSSPPVAGVAAVLGGVLVHLALGTVYCFGNFISYMPKDMLYFKGQAQEGTPQALLILPLTVLFQCVGLPIGSMLQKRIPPRVVALIGSWIMCLGVYLSSYAKDLLTFMMGYSFMFGVGIGMAYTASWVEGWKWFPNRRGFVSGSVLTGFGAGGFFFNKIGTALVNPKNDNALDGLFPPSVYGNWPKMLRTLAVIYAVLTATGAFLIRAPPSTYSVEPAQGSGGTKAPRSLTVREAIGTKQFWMIWACIFTSAYGGLNVSANYKYLGAADPTLNDDAFLSLCGGLGALCNGFGRLFWGSMADAFGFKGPVMSLTALQALLFPLYKLSTKSKSTFLMATMAAFFCLGGNFSIFPGIMPKTFGPMNGAAIYSVMYTAFGTTAVASFFVTKKLIASYGWQGVFNLLGVLSIMACGIGYKFEPLSS